MSLGHRQILEKDTFVLLDDRSSPDAPCVLYNNLTEVIRADTPDQVPAALEALTSARERGLHSAGFLAYELGYLLEPTLADLWPGPGSTPLIWFGLFKRKQSFPARDFAKRFGIDESVESYAVNNIEASVTRERYLEDVTRVKDYISAGDVYQVNYTFNLDFEFSGDPLALYGDLRRKQHAAYGAVVWTPEFRVLSASPEMFLHIDGSTVRTRPMKGTAPRGASIEDDEQTRDALRADPKSQAENLMIVDLLRNDIGRIAEIGSVSVSDLFQVEPYPTVHQMTSTIDAQLRPGTSIADIILQTFPCGSVTGAPKIRAMEIINELEAAPRGIYTGAVGAFDADGSVRLNVAIRTLTLQGEGYARGVLGIGSGIVHDSQAEAEYDECILKARFLTAPPHRFQLFETMLWQRDGGVYLLDHHIKRMCASARYFNFPCTLEGLSKTLDDAALHEGDRDTLRLRMLLDENGEITLETHTFAPAPEGVRAQRCVLWGEPADSSSAFVYHKTTQRDFHDEPFAAVNGAGEADEAIFVNERGELTEGSRTNLFILRDGEWLTPPVSCGLLEGTMRRAMLEGGTYRDMPVREAVLLPVDLESAEEILLVNSLRGARSVIYLGVSKVSPRQ